MVQWHRSRAYTARKAIANDKVRSASQLLHKSIEPCEVIAVVAVAHDHELASRDCDACRKCVAVSARIDRQDASAVLAGDVDGIVRATVVCNYDLSRNPQAFE
jgi:hypothetical protein